MCGLDSDKAKSQSDTRARRGPAGDARAVVALPPMDPSERKATGRGGRRPGPGSGWMEADGCTAKTGCRKEESTEPSLHGQESRNGYGRGRCLPATTARARLHGSQIQMARGAARREPWPQSWSLLGPSIVPAARAANNLMRVPCVRDRSATDVPVWPCACTRGAEALPCLASPGRGSVPAASARPSLSGVGPARRGCCHMG